jgi:alkylation response protein AidB-like acyl-CoA dehydrogenase
MDLRLADTDQLLCDRARSLLAAEAGPDCLAAWEASDDGFDRALWRRIVDLGWPAVALPDEHGGGGGSLVSLGVLASEIGRAAYPSPFLAVAGAGLVAARLGTTKRASAVVEAIARDGATIALAWSAGLTAERHNDGLRLSGRALVDWAEAAGTLVCLAPVAGEAGGTAGHEAPPDPGVAVVAIDPHTPAGRIESRRPFDNERVALVELDGVEVGGADFLVPGGVVAAADAAEAVGAIRLVRAAELVGIAEKILEMTAAYVTTRRQFGVPLGTFQAVQHACADVAILVHGARLATDEGLSSDGRRPCRTTGALAAWLAGRAAVAAAVTGAQLHGGIGMIRDYPLHFYYRRAKAMQLRLGSAADQLEELARVLVDPQVA